MTLHNRIMTNEQFSRVSVVIYEESGAFPNLTTACNMGL